MLHYSRTLQDPETGEEFDVHVDDGQPEPVRNGPPGGRNPLFPGRGPIRPRPGGPRAPGRGTVARPGGTVITPRPGGGGYRPPANQPQPGQITVRTDDLVSLITMGGELWASFLGRPSMPQATGDDVTDRTNAAMHRDSLAMHDQNRDRIRALTGLAERAAKMLLS